MEKENFRGTHLYFIRDRLSGAPETAVIQALSDGVAARGFQAFLEADDERRKEQKQPLIGRIERELVHICALDEDNHVLPGCTEGMNDSSYRVVCTGEAVCNYLEELRNGLRGEEDVDL